MKKATMLDIAKIAGVSKATVSMVINKRDKSISEGTKNKVLELAKKMNYIPNCLARSLNTKKTETIGIILPDIINPFFSFMARAIEDEASSLGYNVIFCNTDNEVSKEEKYIELLISKLVDGVIFISGGQGSGGIKKLEDNNVPFVLVDRYVDRYKDSYGVYCRNKKGVIEGVEYLYNKGSRTIVFIKGPKGLETTNQRFEGYEQAMRAYNIYDEKLVYESDFTIEGGMSVTEKILKSIGKADAIFYSNDLMALGGIKVLLRHGFKIPGNISVIGFDNIQISEIVEPELTTVSQPIYHMGKEACKLLINIINDAPIKNKQIYFETELIIRGTA